MAIGNKTIIAVLAVAAVVVVAAAAVYTAFPDNKEDNGPVTLIDGARRTVTITSSDRVASVNYSATEMICGMGGYDKLAGVSVDTGGYRTQDYIMGVTDDGFPQSVVNGLNNETITDLGGMYRISAESILQCSPDLIIANIYGSSEDTISQLENMGIPIVLCKDNSSIENFYYNIELIGKAIGKVSEAKTLLDQMQSSIKKVADWTKSFDDSPRVGVFISFSESGAYACGEEFYKGTVLIEMLGAVNAFNIPGNYQLTSQEGIVTVNPDVIISGGGDVVFFDSIKTNPILKSLSAVEDNRMYCFVDTCSSVFSSTSVEFVNAVALMAMFIYEEHLEFQIDQYMGDDYVSYLKMFWEQINS
ncbi:MAG: ABC transporter substrate-binding protein [Methanomassiliicoccaceae archaeon]|nr:ABC transporter substrate-binding protein [Methanomassiliicoccaceae archaeon]